MLANELVSPRIEYWIVTEGLSSAKLPHTTQSLDHDHPPLSSLDTQLTTNKLLILPFDKAIHQTCQPEDCTSCVPDYRSSPSKQMATKNVVL